MIKNNIISFFKSGRSDVCVVIFMWYAYYIGGYRRTMVCVIADLEE